MFTSEMEVEWILRRPIDRETKVMKMLRIFFRCVLSVYFFVSGFCSQTVTYTKTQHLITPGNFLLSVDPVVKPMITHACFALQKGKGTMVNIFSLYRKNSVNMLGITEFLSTYNHILSKQLFFPTET